MSNINMSNNRIDIVELGVVSGYGLGRETFSIGLFTGMYGWTEASFGPGASPSSVALSPSGSTRC
jgi:hypothetical protein